jgi:voltage-gated potassium channel
MDLLRSSWEHREVWAEGLLDRLTPMMSALGVLFVLVVLGQLLARNGSPTAAALAAAGWALWAVFVAEFVARLVVAPSTARFLRRNWQVVFLALPALRVLRLVRALRLLRTGRVLSSAVRGSRSAGRLLGGRLGWLVVSCAIVALSSAELLYEFAPYHRFGDALHDAAFATITGEPIPVPGALPNVLEVALAAFSVVVFATVAGSVGAYFLHPADRRGGG